MNTSEEQSVQSATDKLLTSFSEHRSRRSLLRGTVAGVAGVTGIAIVSACASNSTTASGSTTPTTQTSTPTTAPTADTKGKSPDSIQTILNVARTAEQLAVTFYSHGIANASALGISGDNLAYLKAALVEEQIHQQFFTANGGKSLADTFSFPTGSKTFEDLTTFITIQQALEGVFDSAFLAAIKQFAQLDRPDLAQIAGQIACIEAEHRALGRSIAGLTPADNWAFTPVLLPSVGAAPALVEKAGFLSPKSGNSYKYQEVSTDYSGVTYTKPYAVPESGQ